MVEGPARAGAWWNHGTSWGHAAGSGRSVVSGSLDKKHRGWMKTECRVKLKNLDFVAMRGSRGS